MSRETLCSKCLGHRGRFRSPYDGKRICGRCLRELAEKLAGNVKSDGDIALAAFGDVVAAKVAARRWKRRAALLALAGVAGSVFAWFHAAVLG